ncbi:ATP-dependent helicase [Streptomyces sp. TRM64462]|uniref:ATP-dependent helicase n=1 Tax=Streptomyces sp. TRM64462 TaxID=2741726 RepID=UPI001586CF88|nr:ATP-dependent helicase [Streptomyces sp. TRM64462]
MKPLSESIAELERNERQWQAFNVDGHCVVSAPPGSGKTKLLSTRIAFDLATHIPAPQGAACVTLTNAAASELNRRVRALTDQRRRNLFVGTVHAFALKEIIRPFASVCGYPDLLDRKIATNKQVNAAYREAVSEVYLRGEDTRNVVSTAKQHLTMLATEDEWRRAGPRIQKVAHRYSEILATQGLVDFNTLIRSALRMVEENSFVRHLLVSKFPRIYVDEYQDLAPALDRIVRLLCFGEKSKAILFAVGDYNQAIYGWLGSRPELLKELGALDGVTKVELKVNYRCAQEIIDAANRLLEVGGVEGTRSGGSVEAHYCPGTLLVQYNKAANSIARLISKGVPPHEIAVLCPTNDHSARFVNLCRQIDIPAVDQGSPYVSTTFTALIEQLAVWVVHSDDYSIERSRLLLEWKYLQEEVPDGLDSEVALLKVLRDTQPTESASSFLSRLMSSGPGDESGLLRPEDETSYVELRAMLDSGGELAQWTVSELSERGRRNGQVQVCTMSSSKGLEFDYVFIMCANDGIIPHFSSQYSAVKMAEDQRKFYVSVTRARLETHIYYSDRSEWLTTGNSRQSGPSRFLRQMRLA